MFQFRLQVMIVDIDPELDLFYPDLVGGLFAFLFPFCLIVAKLSVIDHLTNGRICCRCDLYEIETFFFRNLQGLPPYSGYQSVPLSD